REDAWIVTANYPFLRAMRLASRRFLFVSDDRADRLSAFRSIVSRLRSGDTVLVFPAGGLELDPALSRAAALASLATRSRRIVLATAIALVVAIPLDLAIEAIAGQAFAVSPQFEPFQGTVAPYTASGLVLAGITYAVIRHFFGDANRVYIRLAIAALVLSWIP